MKIALITYASKCFKYSYADSDRYFKYAERLKESLNQVNFTGDFYLFTEQNLDFPSHELVPYAFKPYAIKKVKDMGYDIVIWADSSIIAFKELNNFIEFVNKTGFVFFDNIGYSIADFTNKTCLDKMNFTNEEAKNNPMIMACLMAFYFNNEMACDIFNDYFNSAIPEIYYGSWQNHRHDQSAMSIILAKKGIKPLHPHSTFFAYPFNEGHKPESQTVCFHNL